MIRLSKKRESIIVTICNGAVILLAEFALRANVWMQLAFIIVMLIIEMVKHILFKHYKRYSINRSIFLTLFSVRLISIMLIIVHNFVYNVNDMLIHTRVIICYAVIMFLSLLELLLIINKKGTNNQNIDEG